MIIHLLTARSNDIEHRKSYHEGHIYKLMSIKSQTTTKNYITLIGGKGGTEGIGSSSIVI